MKVAYLTSMYPDVSHTFILREVLALRARGLDVTTFSVRKPRARNVLGDEAKREADSTRWLLPVRVGTLVGACLWAIVTRPWLSIRTLWFALTTPGGGPRERIKWLFYYVEALVLARWLRADDIEHLHCHFGNSGSSTGMLAARLARVRFSVTCHGSELREIKKFCLVEKVKQASFVACVSKYGRAQLMLACQPEWWDRLKIVRCGLPRTHVLPHPPEQPYLNVLCVGRLSPEKGHVILLDALASVHQAGMDVRCTLVGDGPLRGTIEQRRDTLALGDRLRLVGSVEAARVPAYYAEADVIVLASFSEGVPVVLMEAMAAGRPVVATRVGGVAELVEHARNGLLVPPGDAEALADALQQLATNRRQARELGAAAPQRVAEEFAVDRAADVLATLFADAAKR